MAVILNADNGAVSGISGLTTSADSSGVLQFQSSGTNTLTITTAGNVGVGTNSPTFRLQVETSTDAVAGGFIRNTSTGSTASGNLSVASGVGNLILRAHSAAHSAWANSTLVQSDSGFTGGLNIAQAGANPIKFWTNGSERMRIDSSGNVGIGTSSPNARLDVGTGDAIVRSGNISGYDNLTLAALVLNTNGTVTDIRSNGTVGIVKVSTAGTERMRIDSSGRVGIGTTNPGGFTTNTVGLVINSATATTYNASSFNGDAIATLYGAGGSGKGTGIRLSQGGSFELYMGGVQESSGAASFVFQGYSGSVYAERMRISPSGTVILLGGSTSATGTGITFPATQSASTDANTLDDYEEGTWTPVVSFGGVNVTTVSSNCVYTKVGRLVTMTGAIDVTRGSQTGNAKISGFPFAIPTGTYPISAYWSGLGISGQELMVFNNGNDMYFVGRTGISNVNSGNTPTTVFVLVVNVSFNV
jgi:hypothetical protein